MIDAVNERSKCERLPGPEKLLGESKDPAQKSC